MSEKKKEKSIILSFIIGPLMVIGGVMALWENEGRFNYYQAAEQTVEILSVDNPPHTTVSYTNQADTTIPIAGDYIEEFIPYFKVSRHTEIYSWDESTDSDGDTTWSKGWKSRLESNSRNNRLGLSQSLRSGSLFPERYVVGDLDVARAQIHFSDNSERISVNSLELTSKSIELGLRQEDRYLYLRKGRSDELGDERISFRGIPLEPVVTYFGEIVDGKAIGKQFDIKQSFLSALILNDGILHHLVNGEREVALQTIRSDFRRVVFITRLVGTLVIVFGLYATLSSLVGFLYRVPFIGHMISYGVFWFSLLAGLFLSFSIVISSMIYHHPFIFLVIFGVIAIAAFIIRKMIKQTRGSIKEVLAAKLQGVRTSLWKDSTETDDAFVSATPLEHTFAHLAQMSLSDGDIVKKEYDLLMEWGEENGVPKQRAEEIYVAVKEGQVVSAPVEKKDIELLACMALADGHVSRKEWNVLLKIAKSHGLTRADIRKMVQDLESAHSV